MSIFETLFHPSGKTMFGTINDGGEPIIHKALENEDPKIVSIVEAHERVHGDDYRQHGVNDPDGHREARGHLAALKQATKDGRDLKSLKAKTPMGQQVLNDLADTQRRYIKYCKEANLPVRYDPDENTKAVMNWVLWEKGQE